VVLDLPLEEGAMPKSLRSYLVFLILAVLSASLALSSALLWVVLPRGFHPARRLWVDIHKWGGLALSVLVVVHVLMHRSWLVRMTKRYLRLPSPERPAAEPARSGPKLDKRPRES
jgi:hypothetical protein